jgi:Asp-tRNA(Asn)/Glu-tRNA(Gln) amidotransferase A subunit family amidase
MTGPANIQSARETARRIEAGDLSSEQLVRACLDRIAAREDAVAAWIRIDADGALVQARARDSEAPRGPLHGVPVAIKDVIDTADLPTGYGSPIYDGHRPAIDAECVAMLRRAGAVILGKTVSTEFAAITPGKTANPHNPAHTPGGSSSGSAAAVADRMVPLALGTQTVGSTIRPAAYCGIVGFKPSYGTFGLRGVLPQAPSLDTLGLFGRSVDDIALLADVLIGAEDAFSAAPLSAPPRIAICPSPHWPQAAPETIAAMAGAEDRLAAAGAEIGRVDLPPQFDDALDAQWAILKFEIARTLMPERENNADGLSAGLTAIIDDGLKMTVGEYRNALSLAARCRVDIAPCFEAYDLLLTPSAASEAPEGLTTRTDLLFQRLWTVLHLPCLTLPVFTGRLGLPVGVQLIGRFGRDRAFLQAAAWCERILVPDGPSMPG